MPVAKEEILQDMKEAFPEAEVLLEPLVDDGDHWRLTIVDKSFAGRSRIAQHQMVYQALKGKMSNQLHALQIFTKAK